MENEKSDVDHPSPDNQSETVDEEEQAGRIEEERREEEGGAADLTELALPDTRQDTDYELQRERSREEMFERDLERTASLTELDVPPPVERVSSRRGEGATLESAESRVTAPPTVEKVAGGEARLSEFATRLYIVSYLVFFSILGALARIGLEALTTYPGAPLATGVTWANVGGCLLMGFLAEDRKLFREEWGQWKRYESSHDSSMSDSTSPPASHPSSPGPGLLLRRRFYRHGLRHHKHGQREDSIGQPLQPVHTLKTHKAVKKTIPLYIGLTTGFCGSFTSFSTFMLDVFLALSNDLPTPGHPLSSPTPRNGGYSFMAVLAINLYTLSLSLAALIFGAHLAIFLDEYTPIIPYLFSRKILDPLTVFLAAGCWLGAVFLAIWPPDRSLGVHEYWRGRAVFAIVFAPLGCLLRFYVSLLLNARIPRFPLGTFVVNIFGTMVLAMCFDLQRVKGVVALPASSPYTSAAAAIAAGAVSISRLTGCQVLQGVMDGFCGCTTTVSTWVAELNSLEHQHAYVYGLVTVAVALGMLVIIVGSLEWTAGFGFVVC
ncbi:hypothetical protein AJ79_07747 [Helicocarpus griseus UAMH5409]|uniref:Chromosome condensation protein n=1 Tax=Helicocarpus griseus UAMH5409 TaxID=1447875 RepID=A0A2B7WZG3_9EURO|nr:hypothetical protein AJ79_07747 [Helicocarpus griseus UAMH5409]